VRCIGCDFDLVGATAARRCPECGRAFDPDDVGTFVGEGHTRLARLSASAPGWTFVVGACIYGFLVLRTDFSPARTFVPAIHALLVGLLVAVLYLLRLGIALAARVALPKRRPPVVPYGVGRWLLPIGIAILAHVLVGLHVPRAAAFALDRPLLEPVATGPLLQPSAWKRVDAWSGTVGDGAVWGDVDVWSFDPAIDWGTSGDPREGPRGVEARDGFLRLIDGERNVPGIVITRVPRLAIFPIEGTGYTSFYVAAWAYAPGAPDAFGLASIEGIGALSNLRTVIFVRHRGDWYRSQGWIAPLEDLTTGRAP